MDKQDEYLKEYTKLHEIFADVEENKQKLVDGLIKDAAFLYSESLELRKLLNITGMIKVSPNNPSLQKQIPAAAQYLKNLNSYAVVIKTLNGILSKNEIEIEEDMSDFE